MSQTDSTFTLPRGLDPIEAIAGLATAVHLEWLEQQASELRSHPVENAPPLLVFLRDAYSIDKIVAELGESVELAFSATLQELRTLAETLNAEAESQGGAEGREGGEEENNKEADASADEPIAETDATKRALPLEHRIARFVPLLCTQIESLPAAWICNCIKRVAGQLERASDRRELRDSIDRLLEDHRLLYSKRDRGGGNYDHTTPPSIRKLMVALADPQPGEELIDPCFGFGGLLTEAIDWMQAKETTTDASPVPICVRGADKNRQACLVGMARVLLSTGECMSLLIADHLRWPSTAVDSTFTLDHSKTMQSRIVLAAPPLGIEIHGQKTEKPQEQWSESIRALTTYAEFRLTNTNMSFTKKHGLAVLVVPREALRGEGLMQGLRRYLLHEELVKAVIHLPAGIFGPGNALKMSLLILHEYPFRRETPSPEAKVAICDATPFFEPAQQTRERQITDEGIRRLRAAIAEEQPDTRGVITRLEIGDFASNDYTLVFATDDEAESDLKKIIQSFETYGNKQSLLNLPLGQLVNFGDSFDFDQPLDHDTGTRGIIRSSDLVGDTLPQPKAWVNYEEAHSMHLDEEMTCVAPGDILIACDNDSYHVIDLQEEHFSDEDDNAWRLIPDESIAVLIFPAGNPHSHDTDQRSIDRAITAGQSKVPFADDLVDRDYLLAYLRSRYVRNYLRGNPQALRKRLAELPIIIETESWQWEGSQRAREEDDFDLIDFLVFTNHRPRRTRIPKTTFGYTEIGAADAINCAARANLECERLLATAPFVPTACQRLASELKRFARFLATKCGDSSPISEEAIEEYEIKCNKNEMAELEAAESELIEAGKKDGDKELEDNRSRQGDLSWFSVINPEPGIWSDWLRIIKDRENWRVVRTDVAAYEKVTAWANDFSGRCQALARAGTTENALLQFTLLKRAAAEVPEEPAINNSLNLLCANVARLSGRYLDFLLSDADLQIDLVETIHKQQEAAEDADDEASTAETIFCADQIIRVRNLGSLPLETISFQSDFDTPPSKSRSIRLSPLPDEQKNSIMIDLLEGGACKETRVLLQRAQQPLPDAYELRWSATMLNGKTVDGAIQLVIPSEEDARTTRNTPVDLGSSPYICGSPIEARYADMCFGRDAELQTIRRAVQTQGNVMLLEGNRRMGKSTILHQLLANDAIPGWIGALCSLQGVSYVAQGKSIVPNFYRHLGYQIARNVRKRWGSVPLPDGTTMEKSSLETLRTLIGNDNPFEGFCEYLDTILDKLKAEGKGLLLMIDEFDEAQSWLDQKIDIGQIPENLRYLLQNRENLTGIMTGSIHLRQMRNQYWHPLFGIGQKISVSHLNEDASRQLITDPVKEKLNFTPDAIDLAYRQTAGQPFMLQTLCTTIFDQAAQGGVTAIGTDQIRNAIGRLASGNEHFDALWDYCQSDQQRYLLHLIHREGAGETLSLDRIGGVLRDQGIAYAATKLAEDIESLIELEVLQQRQSAGIMRYGLAIPMMGKWIEENQDAAILKQKVTPEQTRLTLYDALVRYQTDLVRVDNELEEAIATIKAELEGNISSVEKSELQKELLELEVELERVRGDDLDTQIQLSHL